LAISFINITGFAVAMGLSAAMDTLASQAWGAKSYLKVGIYLQRGILVFALAMLPVYALWVNIESVLNLLQQPPCVVEQAKDYIHVYSSCLPALFLNILLERYLQVQNIVYPLIITGVIANVVNIVAHCLFVLVAKWGIRGAGASTALSMYALTISLLVIIFVGKLHKKTWGGWSREALKDWGQFARYGVPGLIMLSITWWSFEMGFIVTGTLPDGEIQQGIHAIILNYGTVIFMIPYSLSVAASVRVGNELGSGHPSAAKFSFMVSLVYVSIWLVFILIFTVSLKTEFVKIFTSDPCLLQAISTPLFFFLLSIVGDHTQGFLSGVVRGCGQQHLGAVSIFFSFTTGVAVGSVLTVFTSLGVIGYWLGLSLAVWAQMVTYFVILVTINWKKQSVKAQKNAKLTLGVSENQDVVLYHSKGPTVSLNTLPAINSDDTDNTDCNDVHSETVTISKEQESASPLVVESFQNDCDTGSVPCRNESDLVLLNIAKHTEKQSCEGNVRNKSHDPHVGNFTERNTDLESTQPVLEDADFEQFDLEVDRSAKAPLMPEDTSDSTELEEASVHTPPAPLPSRGCIPLRIIVYRLALVSVVVCVFVVSLVISQLFVYSPLPCAANTTLHIDTDNESCMVLSNLMSVY
jgi:MATE family multidrug resistance protein